MQAVSSISFVCVSSNATIPWTPWSWKCSVERAKAGHRPAGKHLLHVFRQSAAGRERLVVGRADAQKQVARFFDASVPVVMRSTSGLPSVTASLMAADVLTLNTSAPRRSAVCRAALRGRFTT
jgi:hypothetical protein